MTQTELPGSPESLLVDLSRQRDLYRALFVLASRQKDVLVAGDTAALLTLVEQKRRLMLSCEECDRRVLPWRERWQECRGALPPDVRARMEVLVDEVGTALRELLALEDECTRLAQQSLTATGEEIRRVVEGRRVDAAYRPPPGTQDPRFLDRTE